AQGNQVTPEMTLPLPAAPTGVRLTSSEPETTVGLTASMGRTPPAAVAPLPAASVAATVKGTSVSVPLGCTVPGTFTVTTLPLTSVMVAPSGTPASPP